MLILKFLSLFVNEISPIFENSKWLPGSCSLSVNTVSTISENFVPIPVNETIQAAIMYCITEDIQNPVEILRYLEKVLVTGWRLEIDDPTTTDDGRTNFILVDRDDIIETAFPEINGIVNIRDTLEVQFFDEVCIRK